MSRDREGRPTFVSLAAGADTIFLTQNRDYVSPPDPRARGLNHICLLIPPTDPERLMADLRARGVAIRGTREGTRGTRDGEADSRKTFSVYVEDPDGHGIELEQELPG